MPDAAIQTMTGAEALVSTLGAKGIPSMVERTLMRPPSSRLGPLEDGERRDLIEVSPVSGQYDRAIDRESAYEVLQEKAKKAAEEEAERQRRQEAAEQREREEKERKRASRSSGSRGQSVTEAAVKSITRSVATSLGRALVRGILGSLRR